jgi:very-short-patch-repair endonuclease
MPPLNVSAWMREGQKTLFARHLRRSLTDAERQIWHHLRNRSLMDCKFRRQHPIGPYIVDFACIERGLAIELDGCQHAGSSSDIERSRCLEAHGYRVLRFWNNDVFARQPSVLAAIFDALHDRTLAAIHLPQVGEGI